VKRRTRRSVGQGIAGGLFAIMLMAATPAAFGGQAEELARRHAAWQLAAGDAPWTCDRDRSDFVNPQMGLQLNEVASVRGRSVTWSANPEYYLRNLQGQREWSLRLGFSLLVPSG